MVAMQGIPIRIRRLHHVRYAGLIALRRVVRLKSFIEPDQRSADKRETRADGQQHRKQL